MLDRSYLLLLLHRLAGMGHVRGRLVGWGVDVGSLLRDGIFVRLDRQTYELEALEKISELVPIAWCHIHRGTAYSDLARL